MFGLKPIEMLFVFSVFALAILYLLSRADNKADRQRTIILWLAFFAGSVVVWNLIK